MGFKVQTDETCSRCHRPFTSTEDAILVPQKGGDRLIHDGPCP